MSSLKDRKNVGDELAKLTGTFVNAIAIGVVVVGGFGSFINAIDNGGNTSSNGPAAAIGTICFVVGLCLHWLARWLPKRELLR